MHKINIACAGGPCTGKSTLAALLFAHLKIAGFDYDLINEESRRLRSEFGHCRSPFERLYLWRQQEREELRSTAKDGFISDAPLFQYYVQARLHSTEPRDQLAVRELFRWCTEIEDRYQLIVIAGDPEEIPYKTDQSRSGSKEYALKKHTLVRSFVEHFWPEKILFVKGNQHERLNQVLNQLELLRIGIA